MKFTVDVIEKEAYSTRKRYKGHKGNEIATSGGRPITIRGARLYLRKVLFLVKQIRKLEK